ncbi:hypothetical protein [Trichormus sp. NMC-1]|uniref:hypothetical protein n=1 Tax=Trichormus sp. NMC-1 TaxID=1853259 RepID=UPI0008DC26D6|nr:hypothetical protein [Trichormus sp. NMC-1]
MTTDAVILSVDNVVNCTYWRWGDGETRGRGDGEMGGRGDGETRGRGEIMIYCPLPPAPNLYLMASYLVVIMSVGGGI